MKDTQKVKKALELLEDAMLEGEAIKEAQKEINDAIISLEIALDLMQ